MMTSCLTRTHHFLEQILCSYLNFLKITFQMILYQTILYVLRFLGARAFCRVE